MVESAVCIANTSLYYTTSAPSSTTNTMPSHTEIEVHSFMSFVEQDAAGLPGIVVPQTVYKAQPYRELPAIRFMEGGRLGVNLGNALRRQVQNIHNAKKTPVLSTTDARKTTLRVNWPGYSTWSEIVHVLDHTYDANPITMERLAHVMAQKIDLCLRDLRTKSSTESSRDWWASNVSLDRLFLVELRHVSTGSWQPILCVEMP